MLKPLCDRTSLQFGHIELLRATSKRTGFSMQYLLRQALERVLREARRFPFAEGNRKG